jgi:hypothetical protein
MARPVSKSLEQQLVGAGSNPPLRTRCLPARRRKMSSEYRSGTMYKAITALATASLGAAAWITNSGQWGANRIDHPICEWILNGATWIWTCGV